MTQFPFLHRKDGRGVLLLGLGLLLVPLLLVSIPCQFASAQTKHVGDYKVFQRAFAEALKQQGAGSAPTGPVWIQPEVLKDREACTSCHLGVEDKRFLYARLPYGRHSGHYLEDHAAKRFGCTVCHGGVADGLTFAAAGHPPPNDPTRRRQWEQHYGWRPPGVEGMVPLKFIAGRCAVCHPGSHMPAGAQPYRTARAIVAEKQCTTCHRFHDEPVKRVLTAVRLDGLGSKVSSSWLKAYLKNPHAPQFVVTDRRSPAFAKSRASDTTAMPAYSFQPSEVQALSDYLLSLTDSRIGWENEDPARDAAAVQRGRKLVEGRRCRTCHDIPGIEDRGFIRQHKIGPSLSGVGEKLNPQWTRRWLTDPHMVRPDAGMPRFRFKQGEIDDITAFLSSLRVTGAPAARATPSLSSTSADRQRAAQIAAKYGCAACHSFQGLPLNSPPRTDLTRVGPQVIARLAGGETQRLEGPGGIFHRDVKTPRVFASREDTEPVLTFLAAQVELPVPKAFLRPVPKQRPAFQPTGYPLGAAAKLVADLRCLSCHSIRGSGGDIGPDLTYAGSKLKRDWLVRFLQSPVPVRPMNRARMPHLGLTVSEAGTLADWIVSELKSPEVEKTKLDLDVVFSFVGAAKVKSPYGCITCHRIGEEGGRVGPELTHVGSRLNTKWISHWLRNPQRWKPDVRMPKFEMTEEDLLSITRYLSEQKQKESFNRDPAGSASR